MTPQIGPSTLARVQVLKPNQVPKFPNSSSIVGPNVVTFANSQTKLALIYSPKTEPNLATIPGPEPEPAQSEPLPKHNRVSRHWPDAAGYSFSSETAGNL